MVVMAICGGLRGRVGPALVASATSKGKFLARIDLPAGAPSSRWQARTVELGPSIPDDAGQEQVLQAFRAELRSRDMTAQESGLVAALPPNTPAEFHVAGSSSCLACHQAESAVWQHSGHARAWQTLQSKGADPDPSCRQCHTTGYGLPGGFDSLARSAMLVSVGCESCHGPSAAHVRTPRSRTPWAAADQCVHCHDRENSPKFDFASYWPKIQHGKGLAPLHGNPHADATL